MPHRSRKQDIYHSKILTHVVYIKSFQLKARYISFRAISWTHSISGKILRQLSDGRKKEFMACLRKKKLGTSTASWIWAKKMFSTPESTVEFANIFSAWQFDSLVVPHFQTRPFSIGHNFPHNILIIHWKFLLEDQIFPYNRKFNSNI